VIPLGHRTYLAAKAKGENSMFGKAEFGETIEPSVRRDPDGMVNARLREPKYPNRKQPGLDKMVDIQGFQMRQGLSYWRDRGEVVVLAPNTLHGSWVSIRNLKGTNWAPTAVLNVTQARNAGLPTGREPYGNGAPVVVRGRESRLHGEGGQVSRMGARGGTCDA
jgi:hypothetical protein